MAEGQEDDSSDVMLVTGPTSAVIKREPEAPLNLKSEESCDSNCPSPEPATMGADNTPLALDYNHPSQIHSLMNGHHSLPGTPNHNHSGPTSPDPEHSKATAAHINGSLAGMVTLQNLQNLAALQALPQMAPLATGFQGIPGLGTHFINTPLNLSANATGSLTNGSTPAHTVGNLLNSAASQPQLSATQPAPMPQFILASGQLVQGIQGAQLLIPTSQGLATQTILTIPVNHVTSGQMVNLALNNGQVVTTTLANLQSMSQPHHLLNTTTTNTNTAPSPSPQMAPNLGLNSASLPHILSNSSHQQLLAALQQTHLVNQQQQQQQQQQPLVTTSQLSGHQSQHRSSHHHQQHHHHHQQQQQQNHHYSSNEKHHSNGLLNGSESSMHVINRLAANNSDITITTTNQMPSSLHHKSSHYSSSNGSQQHSPSSDFLADSPNQPTINQTSSNVVDGINLDEIKEFAKAFKLRRLSLGLTQTQVGQALSITEGPAYSQSAICSALATQMYCAQLASQHQNMFEKLDITPKSAQKIKPVLEMWMKEAEERYKSGQNHLTDFIGVEPSKKRKRRTSFTPQALELLNAHFERNTHPSGTEITALGHQLGYDREVIRIWFCNKRQALKNTVRMMSKGMV